MKRLLCLLLAVCMTLSLCACGKDDEESAEPAPLPSEAEPVPTLDVQEPSPEGSGQTPASTDGVDVDLTALSSTMVYSEVYDMLYFDPEDYYGKTIKMTGAFNVYQWVDENGVAADMPVAYACIISDATACCAKGVEFVPEDGTSPDALPEMGAEITVIGEFQPYEENGMTWYHLIDARIL